MDLNTTVTLAMDAGANTGDGSKTVCNQLDCLPILRWSNTIGGLTSRVDDVALNNFELMEMYDHPYTPHGWSSQRRWFIHTLRSVRTVA